MKTAQNYKKYFIIRVFIVFLCNFASHQKVGRIKIPVPNKSISKNKAKLIRSLQQKKQRDTLRLFVAEGPKVVEDLLKAFDVYDLVVESSCLEKWQSKVSADVDIIEVSEEELRSLSFLQHPQEVLAVFKMPEYPKVRLDTSKLYVALDGVQDPGNMGTIIRIADWFGIPAVFCSPDCADVWNPKVVQATMGSLAHVQVVKTNLIELLDNADMDVFGTFLEGDNIYEMSLPNSGIIVMGNEGNGISKDVATHITKKISIPKFSVSPFGSPDSLNVAVAMAVTCSEFRRSYNKKK